MIRNGWITCTLVFLSTIMFVLACQGQSTKEGIDTKYKTDLEIGREILNEYFVGEDTESLRNSAKSGNAKDQYALGLRYFSGMGLQQDYEKAHEWFLKAAEQGDTWAQNDLAIMYRDGLGTTRDLEKAHYWLLKAANQGFAFAQCNLGLMYYTGLGVNKDLTKARDWYVKVIKRGSAEAQVLLGNMYKEGVGAPKNYILAYCLYHISDIEYSEGDCMFGQIYKYDLKEYMTPEQIEDAKKLSTLLLTRKAEDIQVSLLFPEAADNAKAGQK